MLSSTAFQRGRLKQPRRLSTTGGFLTGKLRCTSSIYLAFARYFDVTWLSSEVGSLFFLLRIFWSLRFHPFWGGWWGFYSQKYFSRDVVHPRCGLKTSLVSVSSPLCKCVRVRTFLPCLHGHLAYLHVCVSTFFIVG